MSQQAVPIADDEDDLLMEKEAAEEAAELEAEG